MLDTIRVSVQIFIDEEILDAKWETVTDKPFLKSKCFRFKNGSSIFFTYNVSTLFMTLQFSASKIQHGTNAIAYDFANHVVVEDNIMTAIEEMTGVNDIEPHHLHMCRVDLNRDFVFEDEDTVNAFMDFANKILPARCERRNNYETGFTSQTVKGNGLRIYRKDKDIHLKKKAREKMKPTVRVEFQMNRKFATRFYRGRFNLHQILTNELAAHLVWNKHLAKYGLDKIIVDRKRLDKIAKKYFTETQQKTLAHMNDVPEFEDKELRRKQLDVFRKMKALGICPYSCEIDITLTVNVLEEILNFSRRRDIKKWEISSNKLILKPQSKRRFVKFIDDSS